MRTGALNKRRERRKRRPLNCGLAISPGIEAARRKLLRTHHAQGTEPVTPRAGFWRLDWFFVPNPETIEIEVNHRRRIEREQWREQQAAHDRISERLPDLRARTGADLRRRSRKVLVRNR